MDNIDKYIVDNRLTCNVYGKKEELLIGVGTPMTSRIRYRLENHDWYLDKPTEYVYDNIALLEDDFSPIVSPEGVSSKELIIKAKKIVDLVLNNPIVFSNMKKIKKYDGYTYDHCTQVSCLAVAMGIKMGLSEHDLINVAISALTHDIGKCLIDKKIINKPGKLTDEEMKRVRCHSEYGYQIMKGCPAIDRKVAKIILHHHENYDGSGYPYGLKENEIPLESSIIHLCDVFDALVSERPYKEPLNEYDSVNILLDGSGTKFDPKIVEVFSSSMQIYKIGSIVELPNGTKLEITRVQKDENDNVVEVEFKELLTKKLILRKR